MPSSPITIEQARAAVLAAVHPLEAESLDIAQALGRVLAEDVDAVGDVPPFASSAMDGYAVRASGASGAGGTGGPEIFTVIGESRAVLPWSGELRDNQTVRISNGAAVPDSADTVVRQEDVEERGADSIVLVTVPRPGENIRPAGEVVSAGERVVARGTRLGPPGL